MNRLWMWTLVAVVAACAIVPVLVIPLGVIAVVMGVVFALTPRS